MNRILLAFAGIVGLSLVAAVSSIAVPEASDVPNAAQPGEPVLLELFTSQGCSSCPPADRLARKLDREPGLVVVSRPVTYWDRLGWKDTLAMESNTQQQRGYAARMLSGNNGVYTPQIVIDGRYGEVGSNETAIRRRVGQAADRTVAAIRFRKRPDGGVTIGVAGSAQPSAELVLWAVDSSASVPIRRGENGGRTVEYTNVLRRESKLAEWNGGKASFRIAPEQLMAKGTDRYAVVLRIPDSGRVLAVGWI